jgi:hypothetical protein
VELGATNTAAGVTTIRTTEASESAKALVGHVLNSGSGPSTAGVYGRSDALDGNGVFGVAPEGVGVFGYAAHGKGVVGHSVSHTGVLGEVTATTGTNFGVRGTTPSTAGIGVRGVASATSGRTTGVLGVVHSHHGRAVYGYNSADDGVGVLGYARGGTAFYGFGGWVGLNAVGYSWGVVGQSPEGMGVAGIGRSYGLVGRAFGAGGYAGYFYGATHVQGTLSSTDKRFLIDHPLDPANRTLAHGCVEAPEMLNVYSGTAVLGANGAATVRMPRYFRALNRDYRYQLTAIGAQAPGLYVSKEIERSSFAIAGGVPGQRVCWQVTGVRRDAWARKHPLRVEKTKRPRERGRYLNPEAFGQPRSAGIHQPPKLRMPAKPVPPKLPSLRDG